MTAGTDREPGDAASSGGGAAVDPSPESWMTQLLGVVRSPGGGVRWTSVAVVGVVVLAVALLGWTWVSGARDDAAATAPSTSTAPGPVLMSHDQLVEVAAAAGHSVYWAGARGLTGVEVTTVGRDLYVRYLPDGEPAGATTPYLTVGTYEKADAYTGLVTASTVSGARSEKLKGGAFLVQPAGKATSAYFAFPGTTLLVEVYDPTPGAAYGLVESGDVQPIS
jgi:hypothetical protein